MPELKPEPGADQGIAPPATPDATSRDEAGSYVTMLEIGSIIPNPRQPRTHFDETSLATCSPSSFGRPRRVGSSSSPASVDGEPPDRSA
jgi:hypothetical protein